MKRLFLILICLSSISCSSEITVERINVISEYSSIKRDKREIKFLVNNYKHSLANEAILDSIVCRQLNEIDLNAKIYTHVHLRKKSRKLNNEYLSKDKDYYFLSWPKNYLWDYVLYDSDKKPYKFQVNAKQPKIYGINREFNCVLDQNEY